MGQILHGSATTTEAVRRAIQHSQESLRGLAKRYGVNPKTVAKWKARSSVSDLPTGPKQPRSTVLSAEEEAVVVAFRRHTLLPLYYCLYALQPTIPHLTRSSLHRCLQRHEISRLPQSRRRSLRHTQIQGRSDRLVSYRHRRGSNRARQALPARRHRPNVEVRLRRDAREGGASHRGGLPRRLIAAVPYKVHTVLPDNGKTHFTTPGNTSSAAPGHQGRPEAGELVWAHAFEYACVPNDIDHRLTKPKHPWTNGQVERMNRTIKDATVKRYFYETHDQLRAHLQTSSTPTTSPGGSKPSEASPHTNSSAKPGLQSHTDLKSARSSKCRD